MKTKLLLIMLSVFCINCSYSQKNSKRITITGVVKDAYRNPIVNAIVLIDGRKTGSVTDSQGRYRIKVNRDARMIGIFTFGSGVFEEEIGGRALVNFEFSTFALNQQQLPEPLPGDEAVNLGYNYAKKRNLTTEVTKIDGTKKKYASYSSIYEMIQREVSGVRVYGNSIIIQDSRNISGNVGPLLVVDGVYVNSLDGIPPSTVESIVVLKSTSAAIYGSRGYGGAILVKTKVQQD